MSRSITDFFSKVREGKYLAATKLAKECGISINTVDPITGETALMIAASNKQPKAVKHYLKEKADAFIVDGSGNTALMKAVIFNDNDSVEAMMEGVGFRAQDLLEICSSDGNNPLTKAASRGYSEIARTLLAVDRTEADTPGSFGQTALMVAINLEHTQIIKDLLFRGADVRLVPEAPEPVAAGGPAIPVFVENPVVLAARVSIDMLKLVLTTPAFGKAFSPKSLAELVDIQGVGGKTPLIAATEEGDFDCVDLLLSNGADANTQDDLENTAAHYAITLGYDVILKELLEKRDIHEEIVNTDGYDIIDLANTLKNPLVIKLLKANFPEWYDDEDFDFPSAADAAMDHTEDGYDADDMGTESEDTAMTGLPATHDTEL